MEVRVESADGFDVPPGCYVGVRVGDILKQGRYEPQRCYHFPAMDRRRNAKIDVYRHVGSCIIAVDPDAKSSHEVNVAVTDPTVPEMKLKVNVQSSAVDAGKVREARTRAVKSQAKDYLERYNIEEKLSDAVKALLKDQPKDPTDFLCQFLKSNAGVTSPSGGRVTRSSAAPATSKIGAPSGKPNGQILSKPFKGYYTPNALPNVPATCMSSLYAKFPAAAPRLAPAKGIPLPAPKPDLSKGFKGYYLPQCFPIAPEQSMKSIYLKFPAAAGRLEPSKKAKSKEIAALRAQARETLVKASASGGLQTALAEAKAKDSSSVKKKDFTRTPSVGTWINKRVAPKKVQTFSKMPSVGTWLSRPPPEEEEPPSSHIMPVALMMGPEFYSLGLSNTMRIL